MSDDQIVAAIKANPPQDNTSPVTGVMKSVGTGALQSTLGLAGSLFGALPEYGARGLDKATRFVAGKMGVDAPAPYEAKDPNALEKTLMDTAAPLMHEAQNPVERGAQTVGSYLPNMIGTGGSLARRFLLGAALPAAGDEAGGAVAGAISPKLENAGHMIGGVLGSIPSMRAPTPRNVPSAAALEGAANTGFDSLGPQGAHGFNNVALNAGVMPRIAQNIRQELVNERLGNPRLAPEAHAELDNMANAVQRPQATTLADLHDARQLMNTAQEAGGKNVAIAQIAKRHIDDYLGNIPSRDVLSNTGGVTPAAYGANRIVGAPSAADVALARQGGQTLLTSIGNKAAQMRSDALMAPFGALDKAGLKANKANSGLNLGNKVRDQAEQVLNTTSKRARFNDNEQEQLRRMVEGSRYTNTMRRVGNMLGGGGGLGLTHIAALGAGVGGAGGSIGGGPSGAVEGSALGGAALPLLGIFARRRYNAAMVRQMQHLDVMARARSPLAGNRVVPPQRPTGHIPLSVALLAAQRNKAR
jgi:hypothetical protein